LKVMLRWPSAQGALAILIAIASGCASAKGTSGNDSGSGGPQDMAVGPGNFGDLSGLDLLGVDLTGFNTGGDQGAPNCDIVGQTGCGTNAKCTLGAVDMGNICVSDGTKVTGSICSASSDDCVHSNVCLPENMAGTLLQCRQACNTDADCKQGAAGGVANNTPHCIVTYTGTSQSFCTVDCQPVTAAGASGCATGLACQVFGFQMPGVDMGMNLLPATDCSGPGAGGDGANCATNGDGDCQAGYACVNVGTASHCRQNCRKMTPGDCTAGAGYSCNVPTNVLNSPWGFCCPAAGC
jgi:hypothetical protein